MTAGTERPTLEASVRQSDDLYRTFFEHSNEAIWRFELRRPMPIDLPLEAQLEYCYAESVLEECNAAMASMYGYGSPSELVGTPLEVLLPLSEPNSREFLMAFLSSGYRLLGVESQEQTAQGQERVFLNSLVGIVENGCLARVWGTQSDITASKRMEAQLHRAQRMEAVGRLAGGIAHDFSNLLTVMLASSEIMLESLPSDHPAREDAENIRAAAKSGTALTQQLLTFSRRQQLRPKVVDLNTVVSDTSRLLSRLLRKGITFEASLEPDLPLIMADPVQLEQVIMNLAVNARDAMPDGGLLVMRTAQVSAEETATMLENDRGPGSFVQLEVRDTGHGMDAATKARIFEPFFTSKAEGHGTGLGLATVYGIVEQSGGFIRVDSEVGVGTSFQVFLPTA